MDAQINNSKRNNFKGFAISILIFSAWILLLYWFSDYFTGKSCFRLFIEYGAEISIATSFLSLVWQGLEKQKGLLSWHPGEFLVSCLGLVGLFYLVASANLAGPANGLKQQQLKTVTVLEALWDTIFAVIMNLIMAVLVFAWLICVAPLFYVLVLFTGAPARRTIRDTGIRIIVKEENFETQYKEHRSDEKIPEGYKDVSFDAQPFALTNALNAVVLFIAEKLIL